MSQEHTPEETHNSREGIEEIVKQFEERMPLITSHGLLLEARLTPTNYEAMKHWLRTTIHQELQKAREETEKAYGGCHYCYGKGYGTQIASWVGRGYYKKLPTMKFCTCERGKQLEQLLHSELDQPNK